MGSIRTGTMFSVNKARAVTSHSVSDMSTLSKWSINNKPVRCYDESTHELTHEPLSAIYAYPEMRMYTIRTEDDYSCTLSGDCEVLTVDGWKAVDKLEKDDVLMENGTDTPAYQDYETLKRLYVDKGMTQKAIADMYGVSPRTIRSWVDIHKLHRGDAGALFGKDNPAWKGDDIGRLGGYDRTHRLMDGNYEKVCSRCGSTENIQLHHDDRHTQNTSAENLIPLCMMCHKAEHLGAPVRWIRPARITAIDYAGHEKSFGFDTRCGNAVIDGLIVRFPREGATVKDFGVFNGQL